MFFSFDLTGSTLMTTIARDFARIANDPMFDDLSSEVLHEAKRTILDMMGCAIGGYAGDASRIIRETLGGVDGQAEATIIGSGAKTSVLNAILINGVMLRYLDFNDTYMIPVGAEVQGGHPGELIPAVLALSEQLGLTGKSVLSTIVVGYELSARFSDACAYPGVAAPTIDAKGWNGDTRGAFFMPILAGRLLGLTEDQIEHAIGINGSHNIILGILDASGEEYSMTKNIRFARTAHSGVMSARLAKGGYTGPTRILEGSKGFIASVMKGEFNPSVLTAPSTRLRILDTHYKAVAADATTHGHVNATLQLVNEHDIEPSDVVKVRVRAGSRCVEHTGDLSKKYPNNKESADHSSYYLTAIAIIDRKVGPDQFSPDKWNSPNTLELIDKVIFEADPSLDSFGRAGISEIHTRQGKVYERRVEYPKGDYRNPMSDRELEDKFRDMASPYMTTARMDALVHSIFDLDKADNLSLLTRSMVFDRVAV